LEPFRQMRVDMSGEKGRIEDILDEFNRSWMNYWNVYVEFQDQLYEGIRAAREVSWLAATSPEKLSEINRTQRELFASMPRRVDYMPLGQAGQDLDAAASKLDQLLVALSAETEKCKKLQEAIAVLKEKAEATKEALRAELR
jgi:hypothetical protein